jgi:thiamine-phosphate pyrophosphorylase
VEDDSKMKLIVITTPDFREEETMQILSLFENGLEMLHLRKPDSNKEEYEQLLRSIPSRFLDRIVLHEHFELAEQLPVRGVHLNRRNPEYQGNREMKISKSCHSLDELKSVSGYDHVFLSPIFDSISKEGYNAAFPYEQLKAASKEGLINEKVFALGGICSTTLPKLKDYSFGGAAVLGAIWEKFDIEEFKKIQDIAHSL